MGLYRNFVPYFFRSSLADSRSNRTSYPSGNCIERTLVLFVEDVVIQSGFHFLIAPFSSSSWEEHVAPVEKAAKEWVVGVANNGLLRRIKGFLLGFHCAKHFLVEMKILQYEYSYQKF